jgi:hypothetical protein
MRAQKVLLVGIIPFVLIGILAILWRSSYDNAEQGTTNGFYPQSNVLTGLQCGSSCWDNLFLGRSNTIQVIEFYEQPIFRSYNSLTLDNYLLYYGSHQEYYEISAAIVDGKLEALSFSGIIGVSLSDVVQLLGTPNQISLTIADSTEKPGRDIYLRAYYTYKGYVFIIETGNRITSLSSVCISQDDPVLIFDMVDSGSPLDMGNSQSNYFYSGYDPNREQYRPWPDFGCVPL